MTPQTRQNKTNQLLLRKRKGHFRMELHASDSLADDRMSRWGECTSRRSQVAMNHYFSSVQPLLSLGSVARARARRSSVRGALR